MENNDNDQISHLLYPGYICEYCRQESASWLTHSVHADCFNANDGSGSRLPKSERECMCDCAYH